MLDSLWNQPISCIFGKQEERTILLISEILPYAIERQQDIILASFDEETISKCALLLNDNRYTVIQYKAEDSVGVKSDSDEKSLYFYRSAARTYSSALLIQMNRNKMLQTREDIDNILASVAEQAEYHGISNCNPLNFLIDGIAYGNPFDTLFNYAAKAEKTNIRFCLLDDGLSVVRKVYGVKPTSDMECRAGHLIYVGPQTDNDSLTDIVLSVRTNISKYESGNIFKKLRRKYFEQKPEWYQYQDESYLAKLPSGTVLVRWEDSTARPPDILLKPLCLSKV